MQITPPHGRTDSDKIFLNCEYAGTDAAGRGDLMVFDTTDNRSQAGIEQDTWGLRVKRHDAEVDGSNLVAGEAEINGADTITSAGVLETDTVVATPAPDLVNGAPRGRMILVQCYGPHDAARYGGGSQVAGQGLVCPSNSTSFPGSMTCASRQTWVALVAAGTYLPSFIGFNLEGSSTTFGPKAMFVKCMGM